MDVSFIVLIWHGLGTVQVWCGKYCVGIVRVLSGYGMGVVWYGMLWFGLVMVWVWFGYGMGMVWYGYDVGMVWLWYGYSMVMV